GDGSDHRVGRAERAMRRVSPEGREVGEQPAFEERAEDRHGPAVEAEEEYPRDGSRHGGCPAAPRRTAPVPWRKTPPTMAGRGGIPGWAGYWVARKLLAHGRSVNPEFR